jgi:type IV secretory pathway TrbD component
MKSNVGPADRTIRIVSGLAIGVAGLYFESWLGLVGLIPLATGVIGWCPAYLPFGISTCSLRNEGS